MADQLQPMDLVVNAPLKAGIRRERCTSLYDYFQEWKVKRLEELVKPMEQQKIPAWSPPKPDIAQGLRTVLEVERTTLASASFQASLQRCFVSVGLTRDPTTQLYKKYMAMKAGFLSALHEDAHAERSPPEDSFCLGDDVTGLVMVRPPADPEERELDEDGEGCEESEEDDDVELADG